MGFANNIVSTLQTLKDDNDCKTMAGSLVQFNSIQSALDNLTQDQNARQVAALRKQQQEILLQIANTSNPAQQDALVSYLQTVTVQMAQFQSYAVTDKRFLGLQRKGNALDTLVNTTNALVNQAANNMNCMTKQPGLLGGITGLMGSVSSVALTGPASLMTGAATQILKTVIENHRNKEITKHIADVSSAVSASAYQCVLETLTEQRCNTNDAIALAKLAARSRSNTSPKTPIEKAIRLLNHDTSLFLNWLDQVRAGTPPVNQAMATQQATTISRDSAVRSGLSTALGILGQNKPLMNGAIDEEVKWTIEIGAVNAIVTALTGMAPATCGNGLTYQSQGVNPYSDVLPGCVAGPWKLIGVDASNIPKDGTNRYRSLSDFPSLTELRKEPGMQNIRADLSQVEKGTLDWVRLAADRVNSELALYLNLDPDLILTKADTKDMKKDSPQRSLRRIIDYFDSEKVRGSTVGNYKKMYSDTLKKLRAISCDIEAIVKNEDVTFTKMCQDFIDANKKDYVVPADAASALGDIYKRSVLDNGSGFLSDRLMWALRINLNESIRKKDGVDASQKAALLAANDIMNELVGTSGTSDDLTKTFLDGSHSIPIVQDTINGFLETFDRGIYKSMMRYSSNAAQVKEAQDGPNNISLTAMCLKLASTPSWPKHVPESVCNNRSLPSIYDNGPSSQVITSALIHGDYETRACLFRDYKRLNYIYQAFQGQPTEDDKP